MTARNYMRFAAMLAGEYALCNNYSERNRTRCIMLSMADIFVQDNEKFNRESFYAACEIPRYSQGISYANRF